MPHASDPAPLLPARTWWERRRVVYNAALVSSIVVGGLSYVAILACFGDVIGRPIVDAAGRVVGHETVDAAGIEGIVQCCGCVIAIGIANLFYCLGTALEGHVPLRHVAAYRRWAWWAGVVFSCALPLSIPLLHLVCCLFFPGAYDHTPMRTGGGPGGA